MAKNYLVSLNLNKNELLNARVQNLATAPSSPLAGQAYYDTALGKFGIYNGTTWDYMGTSTATGDLSSNTATSVDSELAVFSGTGGKTIKRATGSGIVMLTSGVLGFATSGTDFAPATTGTSILKANGAGGFAAATVGDYPTLNQNTTGSAATLTTPRSIYGNNFDGSANLNQIIAPAYGGTGNGFTAFTGPATATRTFTLPNANATILTDAAAVTATQGGTGQTTYAVGDILIGGATNTLTKLADVATGSVLLSGGVGVAPSYGKVSLAAGGHVTGTLPVGSGGTGATTLTGLVKGNGTSAFTAATAGTDYYNPGGTDVAVADGGTGASTAAAARTNLGLVIGTDVLAPNGSGAALTGITEGQVANLTTDLAALAPKANPTFTGTVTVPTPVNGTDAANKTYVDNAVQGLSWKQAVAAASTGTLTLSGTQTVDGVALVAGDRVLAKNQTTASANGIYVVAAGAWARAADADTSAEIDSMTVYVEGGTTQADTVWTLTTDNPVINTSSLTFAQINGGATPVADTTTQGKVELATQAETEAKSDSTRAVTPASLATFARKYTGLIGDGAATTIGVTHGLGTQYVTAQVFDAATNALVECDVTLSSATTTSFGFATAPAANAYRVVITG